MQLRIMKLLLAKAKSAEIGQSGALLQQIQPTESGDFTGLRLLLRHKAKPSSYAVKEACLATASSRTISWKDKKQILASLLTADAKISPDDMSKLLYRSIATLPEYTQLPRLPLVQGAEVKIDKEALDKCSLHLLEALFKSFKSDNEAVKSLNVLSK